MNELITNPALFHELPLILRILIITFLCSLAFFIVTWQILFVRLYRRLASAHPQKYDSMGQPSLWWSNSPRAQWQLFQFLYWKDDLPLADPKLSSLCTTIRAFFGIYLVFIIAMISGIFAIAAL